MKKFIAYSGLGGAQSKHMTISSFRRSVQGLGRTLLCAAGLSREEELRTRIREIVESHFDGDLKELGAEHRECLCEALDWIGAESGLWTDVVRLCRGLAHSAADVEMEMGLRLKASIVLKNFLDDPEGAFQELIEIHRLDPFSTKTLELVCAKIGALDADGPSGEYWPRLARSYADLLLETKDTQRQVAVLVLMAWIFSREEGQEQRVYGCLKAAHSLDPKNEAIADKVAGAEMTMRGKGRVVGVASPIGAAEMERVSSEFRDALERSMADSLAKPPLFAN